ncbi:MAG: Ig-like domain-containing protein [Anaerolineae bacterium]
MRRNIFRWGRVSVLTTLLSLALAASVLAADPTTMELQAPQEVSLGDVITVTAVLRDGQGLPIPAATIILWSPASFLSTDGAMRLGQATTDAQGRATFLYEARREGALALNAYFSGDSRYAPAQVSADLTVQGSAQLYQETAGVRVPGVGVWLLVGLLVVVWSIFFTVMVLLTLIAREGSKASYDSVGGRYG